MEPLALTSGRPVINPEVMEKSGWLSHTTEIDSNGYCTQSFTREDERYRMIIRLTSAENPTLWQANLGFTLAFKDHWMQCSIDSIPGHWSLIDVEEYVTRAYLLLNATPLPKIE